MELFNKSQLAKLLDNGKPENRDKDHSPIVKLILPFTSCVWLLSELDPDETNIAFGLCDLGLGFPELGYVNLEEITTVCHPAFPDVNVVCDANFIAKHPMSVYTDAAREFSQVMTDDIVLQRFATKDKRPSP